jgi:NDP-sugar pyrophosphorylase family protein
MADASANDAPYRLIERCSLRRRSRRLLILPPLRLHDGRRDADRAFVEIQHGASIGPRCKIQSHSFILDGVTIEDEVIVGHGVCSSTTSSRCDHGCGPRKALGPGTPGHACPRGASL